jgi:hypothetical protein
VSFTAQELQPPPLPPPEEAALVVTLKLALTHPIVRVAVFKVL